MQLAQIVVLTRFLDKEDFGLMAMALFVIGISGIFIDMGISNVIIHKQKVNKYQLSTLFWLNILMGLGIYLMVILFSPLIAQFYTTPDLKGVIDLTAVSFLILPWGQQFEALLRRDLKFKALSIRDISSKGIGLVVAVFLAYRGFGVYSLVYANLITVFISVALLVILGFRDYRPKLLFSYSSLKSKGFFSFGFYQMGEKLLNYFNANFDTILIGKILGMEALGLYNIAKVVAMKPYQILNPIITKVAFPIFAKVQNEVPRLKRAYLNVILALTSANAPIYILIIILAKPLVQIVFGPEWIEAAPILQLLVVVSLCNSIGNPVGSLQLARGRADWGFYWNLGMFVFMPLTIWAGSFYGLLGVAYAVAIFKIIITLLPSWYFFIRPLCHAKFGEYLFSFTNPTALALAAGLFPVLLRWGSENVYIEVFGGGVLYVIGYVLLSFYFNRKIVQEITEIIKIPSLKKI